MIYTAGPWWAEGRYIAAKVSGGRPNGEIIATFRPTAGSLRGTIPDEANAQLGAAALDLLKVCKRIVPIIKVFEMFPFNRGAEPNSLADDLFKAIAKAEGQSGS